MKSLARQPFFGEIIELDTEKALAQKASVS
jgi:hypothetical protein